MPEHVRVTRFGVSVRLVCLVKMARFWALSSIPRRIQAELRAVFGVRVWELLVSNTVASL
jgi:hypothetical protein